MWPMAALAQDAEEAAFAAEEAATPGEEEAAPIVTIPAELDARARDAVAGINAFSLELYRRGLAAQPLVLFPWEDHWNTPLADVRRMLGLPANPKRTGGYLTEQFTAMKMAA